MSKSEWGCYNRQCEFTFFEQSNPLKKIPSLTFLQLTFQLLYFLLFEGFKYWQILVIFFTTISHPCHALPLLWKPFWQTQLPDLIDTTGRTAPHGTININYSTFWKESTPISRCSLSSLDNDLKSVSDHQISAVAFLANAAHKKWEWYSPRLSLLPSSVVI